MALHPTGQIQARFRFGGQEMIVLCAELTGKKVLVVESEVPLPAALYRSIEELGAEVLGPVGLPDDVFLILAGNRPDGAIVDGRIEPDNRENGGSLQPSGHLFRAVLDYQEVVNLINQRAAEE